MTEIGPSLPLSAPSLLPLSSHSLPPLHRWWFMAVVSLISFRVLNFLWCGLYWCCRYWRDMSWVWKLLLSSRCDVIVQSFVPIDWEWITLDNSKLQTVANSYNEKLANGGFWTLLCRKVERWTIQWLEMYDYLFSGLLSFLCQYVYFSFQTSIWVCICLINSL